MSLSTRDYCVYGTLVSQVKLTGNKNAIKYGFILMCSYKHFKLFCEVLLKLKQKLTRVKDKFSKFIKRENSTIPQSYYKEKSRGFSTKVGRYNDTPTRLKLHKTLYLIRKKHSHYILFIVTRKYRSTCLFIYLFVHLLVQID